MFGSKKLPVDRKGDRRPGEGAWLILGVNFPQVKTHPVYHVLVVAGSGSGKTETLALPTMYEIRVHRPEHLVITDPKPEALEALIRAGAVQDYYLYSFEESTPATSSLNPIRTSTMAETFFNTMLTHPNAPDPFWGESAADLAIAIAEATGYRSLVDVYDTARSPAKLDELAQTNSELHINWTQQNNDQRDSFRRHILTALRSLRQPHIRRLFSPGAKEPPFGADHRDLVAVQTPLDEETAKTWSPLINATFTHLWRAARAGYDAAEVGTYWVMDEARIVINLKSLENWLSTGRGQGQRLMPIFQAMGQLEEVLDRAGTRTVISNCDLRVFGKTGDRDEAEKSARASGTHYVPRAVRQDAHRSKLSQMINDATGNVETRVHEVEEPLLSADEIMGFGMGEFATMWGSKENTEIVQGTPFSDYSDVLAERAVYPPEQARQLGIAPEGDGQDAGGDSVAAEPEEEPQTRQCPGCVSDIAADSPECPYCGEPFS